MESRFHGVPLSAAQMEPKKAVPSDNIASPGIRAPLTTTTAAADDDDDSDFEYSRSSRSRRSSASSYSEGSFRSGEEDDELETDTEMPYGIEGDYTLKAETEFIRPLDEAVMEEDEVSDKLQVPIATVSRDSDDEDSQGSDDVLEDDGVYEGFSSGVVVRVPSLELEQRSVISESLAVEDSLTDNTVPSSDGVNGKFQVLMEEEEEGSVARALSPAATAIQHQVSIDESWPSSQFSEQEKNLDEEIQEPDALSESMDLFESISCGKISSVPSYPSEEILRDKTGEIDGSIITGLDTVRPLIQAKTSLAASDESKLLALSKGEKKQLDKLQKLRVKYLNLLHKLGFSHEDSVPARVLHHLTAAAESRFGPRALDLVPAELPPRSKTKEDLDYSLSILVIGKTGVGKSSTVNSIFGEKKTSTDPFQPSTVRVREITGAIHGVKVMVFDAPGLKTSASDEFINKKALKSIKKTVKKCPPDVILYVDRLDANDAYGSNLPVFKGFDSYLGSPMWGKSIFVLTHACSLPLDDSDGFPLSCEELVSKRSVAFMQMNRRSMAPLVCLVENNPCKEDGDISSVSGGSWRKKLLQLCCSIKTLSEVNSIVLIPNFSTSLPFSVSSLLQPHVVAGPYSDREMAKKSSHPEQEKGD